jgi:hypothetical protein
MTQILTIVQNWLDNNGFISLPLPVHLAKPHHLTVRQDILDKIQGKGLWSYSLLTNAIWLCFLYKNNLEDIKRYLGYSDHICIVIEDSREYDIDYEQVNRSGVGVLNVNTADGDLEVEDRISFVKVSKLQILDDDIRFCYHEFLKATELKRPWWVDMTQKQSVKGTQKPNQVLPPPIRDKDELWQNIKQFIESKMSLEVDNPVVILDYLDQSEIDQHATLEEQLKIREELSKFYESDLRYTTIFLQKLGFSST